MSKTIIKYIARNKIFAFVSFYILFSALLKATLEIDICIPCLWKSIFRFQCPGCGLTTAFISLLELDLRKAYESNRLIFIIVPFGFYYLSHDFIKFKILVNE